MNRDIQTQRSTFRGSKAETLIRVQRMRQAKLVSGEVEKEGRRGKQKHRRREVDEQGREAEKQGSREAEKHGGECESRVQMTTHAFSPAAPARTKVHMLVWPRSLPRGQTPTLGQG